ncbi:hypothetical protein OG203_06240 [Nocardia sp. NBC_01499]|uniref:sialidase family protein n=1 Tax=Nocardia sp. NBC_01499 TaxID=2903597 RepID=UPI00386CB227
MLGSAPCAASRCVRLLRTTDGATTWQARPVPEAVVADHDYPREGSTIRFADQRNGWMFGTGLGRRTGLWATHDGGVTWQASTMPVGMVTGPLVLAAAAGTVHAVVSDDNDLLHVVTSPVDKDQWSDTSVTIPAGGGPAPSPRIVLRDDSGWIVENNPMRAGVFGVPGGARLVGGRWTTWQPPCADTAGVWPAATSVDLLALCGYAEHGSGQTVLRSADNGSTFSAEGQTPGGSSAQGFAESGDRRVVLAAGAELLVSTDCCAQWTTAYSSKEDGHFRDLELTTPTFGVVMQWTSDNGRLLVTRDGGGSWTTIRFAG